MRIFYMIAFKRFHITGNYFLATLPSSTPYKIFGTCTSFFFFFFFLLYFQYNKLSVLKGKKKKTHIKVYVRDNV